MNTGNAAASTVNVAAMAPSVTPTSICEELQTQNTSLRKDLSEDTAKNVNEAFGPSGATTVAHGALSGGNPIGATSRLLPSRYNKRVVEGLWEEKDKSKRRKMLASGSSNVCPQKPFKYAKGYRPHQSHCESKILETLFSPSNPKPSGTLVLNINWQSTKNPNSKEACEACQKLLCHAQKECNLVIKLCQEDPKDPPEPLLCPPS